MATNSHIEWTDATWNPVTGCSKISPGCKHCYAERLALRLQAMGQNNYRNGFEVTLQPQMLDLPLRWKSPRRIFVNSMSDLFHKRVPFGFVDRVFHTNVKGNIFCTQAAARLMMPQKSGKIILCASIVAVVGEPLLSIYTASKGAILAFCRAAALELAPYGINLNCVLPGTTKTDMSKDVIADPVVAKALIEPIPLGRLGTPEDLVGIIQYLASDEASWTTGQSFIVDGGHTMK